MRIGELPDLPETAPTVVVPCTYNNADYKVEIVANQTALPIYQSGDYISGYLYGYGYVTSSSKDAWIICPMPELFQSGATISITSLTVSMRVHNGGYLGNHTVDMTSLVAATTCQGTALIIKLTDPSAFTYGTGGTPSGTVTNNTPICGYVSIIAAVN